MRYIKINPDQSQVYPYVLTRLREDFPDVSFPQSLGDADLSSFGVFPVVTVGRPSFDALRQEQVESAALVEGVWTQQWTLEELPVEQAATNLAQVKAQLWESIKGIRDRKTQEGGYLADGNWFHSDLFSRVQQIGLTLMGGNIPPGLQWKTMDGTKVPMNQAKAGAVFGAAAAQDQALFAHAEALKVLVDASDNPATVNINAGWPAVYVPA